MDVAVKAVENGSDLEQRVKFLQEAVIMGQFKNPYILQIFGIMNEDDVSINNYFACTCVSLSTSDGSLRSYNLKFGKREASLHA